MAKPHQGDIAFHLVMALCADLDEEHLAQMQDRLGRLLEQGGPENFEAQADVRAAYDAVLQLDGKASPTR